MDVKLLNSACRLAVDVARSGLLDQPSVPAPAPLHRVLAFRRISQTTFATIRRAVDDDDDFRQRVAAEADESDVGRAGWLWLHRPEGWEAEIDTLDASSDPASSESAARLRKKLEAAEAAARRHADQAEAATAARLRVDQKLSEVLQEAAPALARNEELASEVQRLGDERTLAVRRLKETEADLASARRELKLARQANVEAHQELIVLQQRVDAASAPPQATFETDAVRQALDHAVRAAATLSDALADAARSLEPGPAPSSSSAPARQKRRSTRRPLPSLPPGVFEGSVEANRHLVTTSSLTVVVDAYNVARTAWSGLAPEEERRRTVALLEEVHARSGATVVAMFDGDSDTVAPVASRSVRVRFSPTGVTADDAISELVGSLPVTQPVLVVSSDKAVARDGRRQGAAVMGSSAFLIATGR